jgi:quinol-cytochrome oxidoreductase complex cytochrome b subunit
VIGKDIRFVLLGDASVGQEALLRFYVLHVAVLPVVATLLIAIHFWRIRKDGGLSRPPEAESKPELSINVQAVQLDPKKTYSLQGLVRGPLVKVGNTPENSVYSWPNLLMAELFAFVVTLSIILVLSLLFNAPLEEPVNAMHPPNPAKAPWYFLGLQEMVSYSAFWGGVGIPGLFVLMLIIAPYLDRSNQGVGVWFSRKRLFANTVFLTFVIVNIAFIIIGTFFRGPNWSFVTPW